MTGDISRPLFTVFARNWWVLLLRGMMAILFGIVTFLFPRITLTVLGLLFGIYALSDGSISLFVAASTWRQNEHRWPLLLEGILGLVAGFATLRAPILTTAALILCIAGWALATGVLKVVEAGSPRYSSSSELWLVTSGIISIVFAFAVMFRPAAGVVAMIWVIGLFAVLMGLTLVVSSFRWRRMNRAHRPALPKFPHNQAA